MGLFNILGRNVDFDALTLITKGDEEFQKNNLSKAIELFTKAINKDQTNWYPFFRRGKAFQFSEDFDNAINDYLKGIRINDNFDLNRALGESYLMKSDFTTGKNYMLKAFKMLEELEDIDKMGKDEKQFEQLKIANYGWEKANIMNNLAVAYYNLGNKQEAFDCTEKGIEYDSTFGGNFGIRGSIYIEYGDYNRAKESLKIAASLGDTRAQAILNNL